LPQLISITSEAIQAQIRRLLPSQQGFGIDMEASSVITPIIDITPAAEGSQLPIQLQQALTGTQRTLVTVDSSSQTFSVGTGFWRFVGQNTQQVSNTTQRINRIRIGANTVIYNLIPTGGINGEVVVQDYDLIFYLQQGEDFEFVADTGCAWGGSLRQVADRYGTLVDPAGFTFE
jgi:hypothetical protein